MSGSGTEGVSSIIVQGAEQYGLEDPRAEIDLLRHEIDISIDQKLKGVEKRLQVSTALAALKPQLLAGLDARFQGFDSRLQVCTMPCHAMVWCAVLCCAVLCCAVLCCAVLCCAVLCCAVLCCAVYLAMLCLLVRGVNSSMMCFATRRYAVPGRKPKGSDCVRPAAVHCLILLLRMLSSLLRRVLHSATLIEQS